MSDQFPPGGPTGTARACPNCFYNVPYGVPICPNCNTVMPVSTPISAPSLGPPPKKSHTQLIVVIALVALVVVGGVAAAGYLSYVNGQRTIDRTGALQAAYKLQVTCLSSTVDNSTLRWYSGYGYSGYERFISTMGLYNPTSYSMEANLTYTLAYPRVNLNLASNPSLLHLPANTIGHAHFTTVISASELNSLPANPDYTIWSVTLDGTYSVIGTYDTYSVTQHQPVEGSSSTSTLPSC